MNRIEYLNRPHVKKFASYLASVISQEIPLDFTVGFSRNKLYAGFEQTFNTGRVDQREGGGPVYVVVAENLGKLFDMYWWDYENYASNKVRLDAVSEAIQVSIANEYGEDAVQTAIEACEWVMAWGLGRGSRAYDAAMNWARNQGQQLPATLREGREALLGDNPQIAAFGRNDGPIMNSGWTKYYALALPNHIIYDARVGAALGFLVRRYLESLGAQGPGGIPEGLNFRWSTGKRGPGQKLQNPSSTRYKFKQLYRTPAGSQTWAGVNIWANWVLSAARAEAQAAWCNGPDGLRRLEAALFMLGYDLART